MNERISNTYSFSKYHTPHMIKNSLYFLYGEPPNKPPFTGDKEELEEDEEPSTLIGLRQRSSKERFLTGEDNRAGGIVTRPVVERVCHI
jgi:hypothetical protein